MPAADRQKAYRQRLAQKLDRAEAMAQALRDIREILSKSEKPWAVEIRAKIKAALDES